MQKILGYMRKAIQEYGLISSGDRILVGISGGKDSLVLMQGLILLRRFIGIDYEVVGVTLDMGFTGSKPDFSPVAELCERQGVEYHVIPTVCPYAARSSPRCGKRTRLQQGGSRAQLRRRC